MRVASTERPAEIIGTRISAERLRRPHTKYVGASYPGTSRLYEFTVGANTAIIERACFKIPAMYDFAIGERLYLSFAS